MAKCGVHGKVFFPSMAHRGVHGGGSDVTKAVAEHGVHGAFGTPTVARSGVHGKDLLAERLLCGLVIIGTSVAKRGVPAGNFGAEHLLSGLLPRDKRCCN